MACEFPVQEAERHQSSFEALKVNYHDEVSDFLYEISDRDRDENSCELVSKEYFGSDSFCYVTHNRLHEIAHIPSPDTGEYFVLAQACENSSGGKFKWPSKCIECDDSINWLLDRCDGDFLFLKEVWHIFCHQGQLHLNSMRSAMYENDLDAILFDAVSFAAPALSHNHCHLNVLFCRIFWSDPHAMLAQNLWNWLRVPSTSRLQSP
jgi:hypothetical protein